MNVNTKANTKWNIWGTCGNLIVSDTPAKGVTTTITVLKGENRSKLTWNGGDKSIGATARLRAKTGNWAVNEGRIHWGKVRAVVQHKGGRNRDTQMRRRRESTKKNKNKERWKT